MTYTNAVLTVIALLLAAIVAKLYVPTLQEIGPRLSPFTRGDVIAARQIQDAKARRARLRELQQGAPLVWVAGGDVDVSGSTVEVSNTVEVEGEVSLERSW